MMQGARGTVSVEERLSAMPALSEQGQISPEAPSSVQPLELRGPDGIMSIVGD